MENGILFPMVNVNSEPNPVPFSSASEAVPIGLCALYPVEGGPFTLGLHCGCIDPRRAERDWTLSELKERWNVTE